MDRGAQMEKIARLRDYSLEEVVATLSLEAAMGLDMHQKHDMYVHHTPVNHWPQGTEQPVVDILSYNTAVYDADFEDLLYQDGLLGEFLDQLRRDPGNDRLSAAIRARRTVVARQVLGQIAGEAVS